MILLKSAQAVLSGLSLQRRKEKSRSGQDQGHGLKVRKSKRPPGQLSFTGFFQGILPDAG